MIVFTCMCDRRQPKQRSKVFVDAYGQLGRIAAASCRVPEAALDECYDLALGAHSLMGGGCSEASNMAALCLLLASVA